MNNMTDKQVIELLRLLAIYCTEYGMDCTVDMSISEMADDLVNSMDEYTPEAEELKDRIESGLLQ